MICGAGLAGVLQREEASLRRAEELLRQGSALAWARHITGQDPNDLTSWDTFESICVIPGSSNRANGDARTDDELWAVVERTIEGTTYKFIEQFQPLDWGDDPNYCWFVDCAGSGLSETGVAGQEAEAAVSGTYTLTYFGDNSEVWGIPLGDATVYSGFSAGDVNNVGGGVVGLPYTNCPFEEGWTVYISGTTNYNGAWTLPAQNDPNELQITRSYSAETLDGTERAARRISANASAGRVAIDDDGYIYVGQNYTDNTYIAQYDPNDGSERNDRFAWDTLPSVPGYFTVMGLEIADNNDLYVHNQPYVYRFDMDTDPATELWAQPAGGWDMDVDGDGNAYAIVSSGGSKIMTQYAAADGSTTTYTQTGQRPNNNTMVSGADVHVDDELGIVIWGGSMWTIKGTSDPNGLIYNMAVRTFDDSAGDRVNVDEVWEELLGPYLVAYNTRIDVGHITSDGTYIYILTVDRNGNRNLWKYSWDGTELSLEDSALAISATSGDGVYMDSWSNLVVTDNDTTTTFYYFDPNDLSELASIDNYHGSVNNTWSDVGSIWMQGTGVANGTIESAEVAEVNDTLVWTIGDNDHFEDREVCLYADGIPRGTFDFTDDIVEDWNDTYTVVIAGINYYSIYESMPLNLFTQNYGLTQSRKSDIAIVGIDFYQSMGCNLGVSLDDYSALEFSEDNFATAMSPWSGGKIATFPRGIDREACLYLWMWDPIPMCVRGIYPTVNVVVPGD